MPRVALNSGGADTAGVGCRTCPEICELTRSTEPLQSFGLAKSREKRVLKIKNMYGVTYEPRHKHRNPHKHGNDPSTKSPIRAGLVRFLFFQIFVCLSILMVSVNAWAVPFVTLSVIDTKNDDTVFNGTEEKLRISISLSDDPNPDDHTETYRYTIKVDGYDGVTIPVPETTEDKGQIKEEQTITFDWDGGTLLEGTYTIKVEIFDGADTNVIEDDEKSITFDKTPPNVSIGADITEFSPNRDGILDGVRVYYSINEDVAESEVKFFQKIGSGDVSFGQPIGLDTNEGSHTFYWDGGGRSFRVFPDGQYVLEVDVVDKGGNSASSSKTTPITIDTKAPLISSVVANENLALLEGTFISTPIQLIKVTIDAAGGTPFDFTAPETEFTVEKHPNVNVAGNLTYDASTLTLSFGNRLDAASENGKYTASIVVVDRAGNITEKTINFTFDNVAPSLRGVATSRGEFTPGSGVSKWTNFVEATLRDNVQDGLDLSASTIRLTGPNGAVLGRQTQPPDTDKIRWFLLSPLTAADGLMDGAYTIEVNARDKAGNQSGALQIPFIYDNLPPLVTLGSAEESPFTLDQDTIYHSQPLSQIVATFDDAGVGIDLEEDTRIVFGMRGTGGQINALPGRGFLGKERNQLTYILETPLTSRDGSQDGRYALNVQATDTLGNTETYRYQLVYDTQLPALVSTAPAANQTVSELSQVEVVLNETTSGIDFIQSTFRLTRDVDGNAVEVPVNITSDGTGTATLTLAEPVALDGSDDGTYTIEISPTDLAGNVGVPVRREFYLVSQSRPEIRLTTPETTTVNDLTTVVAELSGYIGAGIDFDASTLTVRNAQGNLVPHTELEQDAVNNLLTWNIETPLSSDGSADGEYTVTVTFVDFTRRRLVRQFQLLLDTQLPTVSSVLISGKLGTIVYTNGDSTNIVATFADLSTAGIDLGDGGSTITVTNEAGLPAPGITTANEETNQLTWTPIVLPTDGSADGRYTVTVTPKDKAGKQGDIIYRQFVYDTQKPRITAATPVVLIQPMTHIRGPLTQLQFTIEDVGPAGLELSEQTIELLDAQGDSVSATLTFDEISSELYLTLDTPLAQDGSADGEYTLKLPLVDRSGNVLDWEHVLVYDSQVPRISTVSVNTESPTVLLPQEIAEISESISSITIQFEQAQQIDFTNTLVTLTGPDEASVPITLNDDGVSALTVNFQDLHAVGAYTLSVTAQDLAGNVAPSGVIYRFVLDLGLPSISSLTIGDQSGGVAYVNAGRAVVNVTFVESAGIELSLAEGSNIVVAGPSGDIVPGQLRASGTNQLTWRPISLPADGSVDGRYTVAITPVDKAGRQGEVAYREFIYDTQKPRTTAATPVSLREPAAYIRGTLTQLQVFQFTVEDVGPAGLALEDQTAVLIGPQGRSLAATLTVDEINSHLYLTLNTPLAQNGSADGKYTIRVSLVDKSGNTSVSEQTFVYDSQVPRLISVSVNDRSRTRLVPQQITEIKESISSITVQFAETSRVNFENTEVTLAGPDGAPIPINISTDQAAQLTARFIALTEAGLYTFSITPEDVAGNVAQGAIQYSFRLALILPSVRTVELGGQIGDLVFLNGTNSKIVATLVDGAGTRLALGEGGSNIVVTNPSGAVVPGQTRSEGGNRLIWEPISLPTDGSVDGQYTVAITPIDRAGRQGDVVSRQFIYDTQSPRITASSPVVLSQPVSYIGGGLNQFVFTVEDVGPADLLLETQTLELIDSAGEVVPATVTADALTNQLYLTLPAPFAQDGSVDGTYTVRLSLIDRAGNTADVEHSLIYDSQVPQLSSVIVDTESPVELLPTQVTEVSESISRITLAFEEVTKVDFANTLVTLVGPNETSIPLTLADDGTSQLTASFLGLRQVGRYTLSVTPRDVAGNVAPGAINYQFILNLGLPSVSALTIGGKSADVVFINGSDTTIIATLIDATGIGLVLLGESGSSIVVTSPSGAVVPGQTRTDSENQLIWEPISLPTDGSVDGRYTVAVTPIDKAGRQGDVISRQFIYDTEKPRITASSPVVLSQPVSYIGGGLNQFVFTVEDVGPAGLALAEQTVALIGLEDTSIATTLTFDEINSHLYLTLDTPLAQDGSADGEYTVKVSLVDKAGNTLESAQTFVYDSQVPQLASVSVVGLGFPDPYTTELAPQEITEISESISSITLQFEEATRVDFTNTVVNLIGPDSQAISLNISADGLTQLTARFVELTQSGLYTLSVTPQDIAGNVAQGAVQYSFRLMFVLPSVSTVELGGQTGDVVFLNGSDSTIIATLVDATGTGLDLGEGGSSIVVTNPSGAVVPGQTRTDGVDQLIWQPISLPTDGSADGRYAVAVTPIDKAGRQGDVVSRQFIYDTEKPRITASSPVVLSQPVSYIGGGLNQFVFTVEDVGPADLLLETQTLELIDSAGEVVPATVTADALTNQLYLTLPAPFAQDGSVDGPYTVRLSLIDRAGNTADVEHSLIYDSQVPQLSSVIVDTESPVELLPTQVTEVSESISRITLAFEEVTKVDFANTLVTLVGPNETSIPLTLADDGTSQLTASFLGLRQVGRYTLSVTPRDVAGNVAPGAINYQFILNLGLPSVSALTIGGKSADVVFINGSDTTIIATLIDATGIGLVLLGESGSSIVVTSPSGAVVPGQTRTDSENQLIWEPLSLPTDGSADGRYTVAVTPIDKAGRQGDVVSRQFIYDTEKPRITASSPVVLSQPVSYISDGLSQFVFTVEDVGPADLLLEAQTIALADSAGNVVPATVTYDALTNQLYLTLSSPFARDGGVDGAYTVRLSLIDRAGNALDLEHLLIYDSQVPHISSVTVDTEPPIALIPQGTAEVLEPISSITIQVDDATRVDFANTVVTLVSSNVSATTGEADIVNIPLTLQDDGTSEITASFPALKQLDTYILSVTPRDVAGNVAAAPINYTFILDIPLPSVSSVIIGDSETAGSGDVAYVNASNMIIGAVLLDPTETGLAFGNDGSDITVAAIDNTIVAGELGSNGVDLLVWEPITLTTDGTTDGRYRVYVKPVDKAGREGKTVYREFIYDTQEPEIVAADPIDLSQPVSYMSQSLTQFQFTVVDAGPAELELSDQQVSLRDASGNLVPAQLTNDTNNQLFLTLEQPLPLDGSMDGAYTVAVELADKAGNAFTVEHQIVYDTQAPTLTSTVPADGALLTEDVTQIQVTLNDEGGSGIDWTATTVVLVSPSGQQISGEVVSDGTTTLTLSTNQLVEDGRYIIRVQAVDRAGNGEVTRFERSFLLSRRLPTIVSTEPVTAPVDEAFTNEEIERIAVELETDDENHLSTLRLLNPGDQVVAGQQQRASGRLIYNLVRPLATDGSEDGRYTIEFTPISASGRNGETRRLTFIYDTQAPEIENDDVIDLVVAQPGANNSLTEIRVNLTDETAGIDWKNLDEKWLTFERLSPNAAKISGRVDDDGQGNLIFRLTVPLADNGSADGEYQITVNPKDRAGNDDEPYEKVFVYDTSPPMIDTATLLINNAPLLTDINAEDYPTAISTTGGVVIQASIFDTGLGVNLAQSKITVRRPDGSELSGNTQQNGVDTIIFKSDGLTFQGNYQVEVTSIGNDSEHLGFAPSDSITTEFLYETGEPTAAVTSDGGETELTDEPLPLEGTAADPAGTQRIGEGEIPVPASGVWLVEIVGLGPDDQPIDPVPAVDDSNAQEEPWSRWSIDFLPTRSGEYDLDVRVTDNAGNYAVYDIGKYTMSVSLTFRGSTFGWPNPLRLSQRDVAFFSFDVNVPRGETIDLTLSIYDWSGDMVLSQTYPDVVSGQRNDQLVKWNLENQAGTPVARGLYIFRLEAVNAAGNRANTVGKVLVVD